MIATVIVTTNGITKIVTAETPDVTTTKTSLIVKMPVETKMALKTRARATRETEIQNQRTKLTKINARDETAAKRKTRTLTANKRSQNKTTNKVLTKTPMTVISEIRAIVKEAGNAAGVTERRMLQSKVLPATIQSRPNCPRLSTKNKLTIARRSRRPK